MRTLYLLIILGLVSFMTWEFNFFTKHYAYLEGQLNYVFSKCK